MMGRADHFILGDHNAVCFQCGFKRKASYLVKNWRGYYVCPEHNEPREQQDFVRAMPDNQAPPWTQSRPPITFTYTKKSIGLGDGVTRFFQLGDGLSTTTITLVQVNAVNATYTDNGTGGITLTSAAPKGQVVTASGSETSH